MRNKQVNLETNTVKKEKGNCGGNKHSEVERKKAEPVTDFRNSESHLRHGGMGLFNSRFQCLLLVHCGSHLRHQRKQNRLRLRPALHEENLYPI